MRMRRIKEILEVSMEYDAVAVAKSEREGEVETEGITEWEKVLELLPADLESSAKEMKALVRRRGIHSGGDLLRICLAYGVCDWSLRLLAVWCTVKGICDISDVALLGRLRQSTPWLGRLLVQMLGLNKNGLVQPEVSLRLMDATVISRPGSKGTDWRVHLSLNVGQMSVDGVEVTDAKGGESLARLPSRPGEIVVADRGLAFANSLGPVLAAGAWLAVRLNWQNLPLWEQPQQRFDITAWLSQLEKDELTSVERTLWLPTPQGNFLVRLVAGRLPQAAAERARQRVRENAKKKGRTPDQRSLLAAGFLLVLTNLPALSWSADQVLHLYRLRWQVELSMKRLKSLLHLDHLRAQDPALAQAYLLSKLLAALILDRMTHPLAALTPHWFVSFLRPLSLWRLTSLLQDHLISLIRGAIDFSMLLRAWPRLGRFLRNPPRQRSQQDARLRSFFASLSLSLS